MTRVLFASLSSLFAIFCYFLLNSTSFERIRPNVYLQVIKDKDTSKSLDSVFFNPDNDIRLSAFDSSGLSAYSLKVTNAQNEVILSKDEVLLKKSNNLSVILPKLPNLKNGDEITYTVSVRDWSNINFFKGNETVVQKKLVINKTIPQVQVVATSEQITYGGSALVAFQVKNLLLYDKVDGKSIDKVYVSNGQNNFEVYPYINKQGNLIYIALIAWPIQNTFFNGTIRVIDSAMNERVVEIPIQANVNNVSRKLNININDKYLNAIVPRLEKNVVMPSDLVNNVEKFQFFNETIRYQEHQRLASLFQVVNFSLRDTVQKKLPRFNVFMPIRDAQISGRFGDEYIYRYNKENIGLSRRFGIDLLGEKDVSVINSNAGEAVSVGTMGTYGNFVAISHALGVSSVYGYLDSLPELHGRLSSLSVIGKSGRSGIGVLDGVHFALLVQGYFVNPLEWLNPNWVDVNINQVLEDADNFGIRR